MSMSSGSSRSTTTGNDALLETNLTIGVEADVNGHALHVDLPVYKQMRGDNEKVELVVQRGFKLKVVTCDAGDDGGGDVKRI